MVFPRVRARAAGGTPWCIGAADACSVRGAGAVLTSAGAGHHSVSAQASRPASEAGTLSLLVNMEIFVFGGGKNEFHLMRHLMHFILMVYPE